MDLTIGCTTTIKDRKAPLCRVAEECAVANIQASIIQDRASNHIAAAIRALSTGY